MATREFDLDPSPALDALRADFDVQLVARGWTSTPPVVIRSDDANSIVSAVRVDLKRKATSSAPLPSEVELSVRQRIELYCL